MYFGHDLGQFRCQIGWNQCESARIDANLRISVRMNKKKKGRIGTSEERRHVVTSPVQVRQP